MDGTHEAATNQRHEKLKAALQQALADDGVKQSAAARQIGIDDSSLSRWLKGSYGAGTINLDDRIENWLRLREKRAETPAIKRPGFVPIDSAKHILAKLSYAQTGADFIMVTGEPGVGKTLACVEYQRRHPNVWIITISPAVSNKTQVLMELCVALGIETNEGAAQMHRNIVKKLTGTQGLLIVDEAQALQFEAKEQLRAIWDAVRAHGMGMVFVGNNELITMMGSGRQASKLDRLHSRVAIKLSMGKPTKSDVDKLLDEWGLQGKCRATLHRISQGAGALREMCNTLNFAASLAAVEVVVLSGDHIEAALAARGVVV